jgi:hypothetical protein
MALSFVTILRKMCGSQLDSRLTLSNLLKSMRWARHVAYALRCYTKYLSENFKGETYFEDIGIKEQIMLNWNFQKTSVSYEMDGAA